MGTGFVYSEPVVFFHIEKLRGFPGGLFNVNIVFKNPAYVGFLVEVRLVQKEHLNES